MKTYYNREELLRRLNDNYIKVRIENNKPPLEVDFEDEEKEIYLDELEDSSNVNEKIEKDIERVLNSDSNNEYHEIDDIPVSTIVGVEAYSEYFSSNIQERVAKEITYEDVIFRPLIIEYEGKMLEFRISSMVRLNVYGLDSGKVEKILTRKEDQYESELGFQIDDIDYDVDYVPDDRQVDVDIFEKTDNFTERYSNIRTNIICIIPQEVNAAIVLRDHTVSNRLKSIGIDTDKMSGKNCRIYIDGEELQFQKQYLDRHIVELLTNVEYRNNYELLNKLTDIELKNIGNDDFDIDTFKEQYDMVNHNVIDSIHSDFNKSGIRIEEDISKNEESKI